MNKIQNKSLKAHNTFGIDVTAKRFLSIESESQLIDVLESLRNDEFFVLGGGSNLLLTKDIDALVLHIDIKGIQIEEEDENFVVLSANAGENWHEFVQYCIKNNYGGVENLSLIPGNVGTAPIQNIGAYGVELKDVFDSCRAIHVKSGRIKEFAKSECNFGYRDSIFKSEAKGEYIITKLRLRLTKKAHEINIDYGAIRDHLSYKKISLPTIREVADAVIAIRQSKLPDPAMIGNSGSFFKNPILSNGQFKALQNQFPDMPSYHVSKEEIKIPAGWLIEKAGFKGKRFGDYGVHEKQALVLVNYGCASGEEILKLSELIQHTVYRIFNIKLEAEVNII